MPLTDIVIRRAKPRDRDYKLSDGGGLCLLVKTHGAKWWRYRYRFGGAEQMLSLGVYPDVSLSEARERKDVARKLIAQGINPSAERKAKKEVTRNTFEAVARQARASRASEEALHRHFQQGQMDTDDLRISRSGPSADQCDYTR